ncbi:MAG: hypothetical protein JRN15_20810 [Nitrososphaerota archaeon]|nr:hypothetical protein [Nitrososphaerota archaeon]
MKAKAAAIILIVPVLPLVTILEITAIPSAAPNISSKNREQTSSQHSYLAVLRKKQSLYEEVTLYT